MQGNLDFGGSENLEFRPDGSGCGQIWNRFLRSVRSVGMTPGAVERPRGDDWVIGESLILGVWARSNKFGRGTLGGELGIQYCGRTAGSMGWCGYGRLRGRRFG